MSKLNKIIVLNLLLALGFSPLGVNAQLQSRQHATDFEVNYSSPKKYELGGIVISGTKVLDPNALVLLTGLRVGNFIDVPGEQIAEAIKKLWKQGLFSDVQVFVKRVQGNKIFLEFVIAEQPRLSRFKLNGVSKGEADKLRDEINLYRERVITSNVVITTKNKIRAYFVDKGFFNITTEIIQKDDSLYANHIMLIINIDKHKRVKIEDIVFHDNNAIPSRKLKKTFKETRERSRFEPLIDLPGLVSDIAVAFWNQKNDTVLSILKQYRDDHIRIHFKSSKYIKSMYKIDKEQLLVAYKAEGYRDIKIESDTLKKLDAKNIRLDIYLAEGKQYFFRNIKWIGNTKYPTEELSSILGIEKGDIYNQELLDTRLFMNPAGLDVSSKYMDDGYLFFQVTPVEVNVEKDSIDLEIRIYEGTQARVNKILISGNTKTNEHVIRREIRTKPGDLFSRTDIMRTQRELSLLGYFDPEKMNVIPKPNPIDGTVDIEYIVAEKPSDQVELSGGYGGGSLLGTIGLTFSNFSTRNLFNKKAWQPLPAGDGQRLSIRAQTNGIRYNSINFSFTEPWLGGKRPNAFTFSTYYTLQTNGQGKTAISGDTGERIPNPARASLNIFGVSVGLGKRLTWPDDNFQLYQELTYQYYDVRNWVAFQGFNNGFANNIFYKIVLTRSSLDDLNFPKSGSRVTLSAQLTPPYSWFNGVDYEGLSTEEKFHFVEYNKWKFTAAWYNNFAGKFVFYAKVGFGGLFQYSPQVGTAPFERFYLGGSGLSGFSLDAREVIALRGYDDNSLSPITGAPLVTKYTAEVRYPFSTNPNAMIYGLVFAEMGNTWRGLNEFSPFNNYRSAGIGVRVFLPMFGLLGLDWGYRFDDVPTRPSMKQSQLHFTIGANLGEL